MPTTESNKDSSFFSSANLKSRLRLAALVVAAGLMVSRVLGLVREMVIAHIFGAGPHTDAYKAAFTVPDLLNYLLAGGALSITFIPLFSEHLAQGREKEAWRTFSVTASVMTLVLLVFVVALEVAAPRLVPLLVPGFDPATMELAVHLTRIVLPAQIFFYLGGLVSATLYARGHFIAPALAPAGYNLGIIAGGLLLGPRWGVAGLSWGALAGSLLGPLLIPLVAALRKGLSYRPSLDIRDPGLITFLKRALPIMLGLSLVTTDEWIMRFIASGQAGQITLIDYARRFFLLPIAFLGQAAGQATLPFFARLHAEGRKEELADTIGLSVRTVAFLALLLTGWLFAAAPQVVSLLLHHGSLTTADAAATAHILSFFALGMVPFCVQALLSRAFYGMGETWTPMIISTAAALLGLPLFFLLYRASGAPGLALASAAGLAIHCLILGLALSRKLKASPWHKGWSLLLRQLAASALAAAAAWPLARLVDLGPDPSFFLQLAHLSLITLAWLAMAMAACHILGIQELQAVMRRLRGAKSRG